MNESLFLKELVINREWSPFLTKEICLLLISIETEVAKTGYTPSADKVLRFLTLPLSSAKIIILGQDPYPQQGSATGRAFEVGGLHSWTQPFTNISLKNILRGIYKAYSGQVVKYNQLKGKFDNEFQVLPPGQLFSYWENQGVLLLNTSFTCEPGKPGTHQRLWAKFSHDLLLFISAKAPVVTWFLWGSHAQQAAHEIPIVNRIETMHPMMCYDRPGREGDFLFGKQNCFRLFIEEIDWTGYGSKVNCQGSRLLF